MSRPDPRGGSAEQIGPRSPAAAGDQGRGCQQLREAVGGRGALGWAVPTSTANAGAVPGFSVHLCPQAYVLAPSSGGLLG